jgi:exosome complex RNA-binding protein Rrp42 (RNase PH superfamily)
MPFDQKRVNGPESSFSYRQFIESKEDEKQTGFDGKRSDGRKMQEHRKLAVQLNAISRAKGSNYIENGNTKVICGVFELREIPRNTRYA